MVKPKKYLGQHFLTDKNIANTIVDSLTLSQYSQVIEIGPGMGVLTEELVSRFAGKLTLIEIDEESAAYIKQHFDSSKFRLLQEDFLHADLNNIISVPTAIIGNFPYNISTQILFKVYEHRNLIPAVVGMFQKEVAERICSATGKKAYGIQSVLLQSCYDCEYLFTVEPNVFNPPPKVKSGVIRLKLNSTKKIVSKESDFRRVVKAAFNQRRKILKNALKQFTSVMAEKGEMPFGSKRAEELHWTQFDELTQWFYR